MPNYKFKSGDYVKRISPRIGFCEIQGNRYEQQDVLVAQENLAGIEKFSSDAIQVIFKETIFTLQNSCGNEVEQGSTLCNVTAWRDHENILHAYTSYVGDSSAFLVILDDRKEIVKSVRLNQHLHNPERGRLSLDFVSLALNRAIGDTAFEQVGLSHEPEMDVLTLSVSPQHEVFMVVACDGLTEGEFSLQDIAALVAMHSELSLEEIAKQLVLAGYAHGSDDNISVAVMKIDSVQPISVSVFDGHGGDRVSRCLGENFFVVLQKVIDKNPCK